MRLSVLLASACALLVAASGFAAGLGGLTVPSAPLPVASGPAPAQTGEDGAHGLPGGCERDSATRYSCTFEGSTQGMPVPANPVLVPEGEEVQRFELPLGKRSLLEASVSGAEADRLFLALAGAGGGTYAAVDAGDKLRHSRVADANGTVTLVLGRAGNAGGAWSVTVTVDDAPTLTAPTGVSARAEGAAAAQTTQSGLPCAQGYCVLGDDRARARSFDAPIGDFAEAGAILRVDITRTGGSDTAGVSILDASGAERAATTLDAGGAGTLELTITEGLGTFYLRFGTDVADPGAFEASGTVTPPPEHEPEPDASSPPTNGTDGSAGGNVTDPASPGGNVTDPDGDASRGDETLEPAALSNTGPRERYLTVGFYTSAVLVGLTGVLVVALVTRKW